MAGPLGAGACGSEQGLADQGREDAALRAGYYLDVAREAYAEAVQRYAADKKGEKAAPWFNKVWDAQSQLSAALSWAEEDAGVWFEAANLTFQLASLARLSMPGHHLATDALSLWAYALRLEAGTGAGAGAAAAGAAEPAEGGALARRLKSWLRALAEAPVARRLWPEVTLGTWSELRQRFAGVSAQEALRQLPQRRFGRCSSARSRTFREVQLPATPASSAASSAACASTAPAAPVTPAPASAASVVGGGRLEVLFPTYIYRKDLRGELGEAFFEKLGGAAVDGYRAYRERYLEQLQAEGVDAGTVPESRISNGFFRSQGDFGEASLKQEEVRARWPELWGSEEFSTLLGLARAACLEYLRGTGVELSGAELEASTLYLWAAVYPQDPASRASHSWHLHQTAIASGVIYAANPRRTPLVFADPRGAPPFGDQDAKDAEGRAFEPRAPFDAAYRVFAEEGELVVFPPWLHHRVPPVLRGSGGWRVAFPFNFHAGHAWDSWERTAAAA